MTRFHLKAFQTTCLEMQSQAVSIGTLGAPTAELLYLVDQRHRKLHALQPTVLYGHEIRAERESGVHQGRLRGSL